MLKIIARLTNSAKAVSKKVSIAQGVKVQSAAPVLRERLKDQPKRKSGGSSRNEFTSYYGRPVVKKAHWVWQIWLYFWVGGITAGVSAIAAIAQLVGDPQRDRAIIRAARYISLLGLTISPMLLIWDLQRPERFYNMLRVLKLRSPLSVGTYILAGSGILAGVNAVRQLVEDGVIPAHTLPGKMALAVSNDFTSLLQGVAGLGLGSYTGVLLTATATPLWAEGDIVLGPLFLASAFSTGAASLTLACSLTGVKQAEIEQLGQIEQSAMLTELLLTGYWLLKMKPEVRKVLTTGQYQKILVATLSLAVVAPLTLQQMMPKKWAAVRILNILNALMVLSGGFLLRYTVVEAGKVSTQDSTAYHATTRGVGRPNPAAQAAAARPLGKPAWHIEGF
jgi:formate-dependent nitrite reductase membrane component NrfD